MTPGTALLLILAIHIALKSTKVSLKLANRIVK